MSMGESNIRAASGICGAAPSARAPSFPLAERMDRPASSFTKRVPLIKLVLGQICSRTFGPEFLKACSTKFEITFLWVDSVFGFLSCGACLTKCGNHFCPNFRFKA